ncbi:MAG: hypothetical protein WC834_02045, partial [Eubacteriales bacterium]
WGNPWPCGSASIFGKWRIKGNKGNPLCGQPSPLTLGHLPTSRQLAFGITPALPLHKCQRCCLN